MRGKGYRCTRYRQYGRITPAYAGKSLNYEVLLNMYQDHPRLCGEKLSRKLIMTQTRGSPPPMRGKVKSICKFLLKIRITPAYAGKSQLP